MSSATAQTERTNDYSGAFSGFGRCVYVLCAGDQQTRHWSVFVSSMFCRIFKRSMSRPQGDLRGDGDQLSCLTRTLPTSTCAAAAWRLNRRQLWSGCRLSRTVSPRQPGRSENSRTGDTDQRVSCFAPVIAPDVKYEVVPFDQIIEAVQSGDCDAGLLIHEGQLFYETGGSAQDTRPRRVVARANRPTLCRWVEMRFVVILVRK